MMNFTINFNMHIKQTVNIYTLMLLSTLVLFLMPVGVSAQSSPHITSMNVDATLQKDGDLFVSEMLMYNFVSDRSGFVRSFPIGELDPLSVVVNSVERDGLEDRYQVTERANTTDVNIGHKDIPITGRHEYVIKYLISDIVTQGSGEDTMEWQAVSNFSVPIEQIDIGLTLPEGAVVREAHCWYGQVGARECSIQRTGKKLKAKPQSVQPDQSIILTAKLSPQTTEPSASLSVAETGSLGVLAFVAVAVIAGGWMMYRRRQHFANSPAQATNSPPGDLHPIFIGSIAFGKLFAGDIAGGLVYMASRGKLKFERTEASEKEEQYSFDDLQLTLTTSLNRVKHPIEYKLLTTIFGEDAKRGEKRRLSDLSEKGSLQEKFRDLERTVKNYLVENDLMQPQKGKMWWEYIVAAVVALVAGSIAGGWWMATGLLISIASLTVMSLLPKRTYRGQEIRQQLRGFGWFLQSTKEERSQLRGVPTNLSTREFTRLLPYATAFNVERQWGDQFSDAYVNIPYWYESVESVDHQTVAPELAEEVQSLRTVISTWTDHAEQKMELEAEIEEELGSADIDILEK